MDNFQLDFLGIGTIKSGTSLLADLIMQHPQVQWASRKEVHYFNRFQADGSLNPYFEQPFSFYRSFFPDVLPVNMKRGEYSPVYITDTEALEKIHSLFPEIKLILSLRNPVDRAFSHFLYARDFLQQIPQQTCFESAWKQYPYLKNFGLYSPQLKKVFSLFPASQYLVLIFEEMIQDPAGAAGQIYRFIGVDNHYQPLISKVNPHKKVRYQWLENMLNTISAIKPKPGSVHLKWWYNSFFYPVLLDWKHRMRDANVTAGNKPDISAETYQRLMKEYEVDISETEKLLDRMIPQWH